MYLCLYEDDHVAHLHPLTLTRPAYDLRLGLRTLLEAARDALGRPSVLLHARSYLASFVGEEHDLVVNRIPEGLDVLFVNGRCVLEEGPFAERLRRAAQAGEPARAFVQGSDVVAAWAPGATSRYISGDAVTGEAFRDLPEEQVSDVRQISRLWHLLDELPAALERDYADLTHGYRIFERTGARIGDGAILAGADRIYIAPGATIHPGAILNSEDGPMFIGPDVIVREGAVLRGPVCVGAGSEIKTGANIEGASIGPVCKVSGEVKDCILHSYANKSHEGHLGNAYIGSWCNLGAGTNNSNLKNDYGIVSLTNPVTGEDEPTGRQFLGMFMGDHSKSGIGTMFNTGSIIGVSCNIYGPGFQPRNIPSFSWGGADTGFVEYRLDKALRVAEVVMARRDVALTEGAAEVLKQVFEATR